MTAKLDGLARPDFVDRTTFHCERIMTVNNEEIARNLP